MDNSQNTVKRRSCAEVKRLEMILTASNADKATIEKSLENMNLTCDCRESQAQPCSGTTGRSASRRTKPPASAENVLSSLSKNEEIKSKLTEILSQGSEMRLHIQLRKEQESEPFFSSHRLRMLAIVAGVISVPFIVLTGNRSDNEVTTITCYALAMLVYGFTTFMGGQLVGKFAAMQDALKVVYG